MNNSNKKTGIPRLLELGGQYRYQTILACVFSAISAILMLSPFICIWYVMRDVINALPNLSLIDTNTVAMYGWTAVGLSVLGFIVYAIALTFSHLGAFHTAKNMKSEILHHLSKVPLGFFSTHSSGQIRKIIDENSAQTEAFLAHQLPDMVGSIVTSITMIIMLFFFDWRLGFLCVLLMVIGFGIQMTMTGKKSMEYMKNYQDALEEMNKEAVEYVRGIPVVKVFQQTIYSFKSFYSSITKYRDNVTNYALACELPMVAFNVVINASFVVLILAAIFILPNESNKPQFLLDLIFYILFVPACSTMLNKILFSGTYKMIATEAVRRIDSLIYEPVQAMPKEPKAVNNFGITFEDVVFKYPDADKTVINNVNLTVPEGKTVALVGPSGGGKSTIASLIPRFWDVKSGSIKIGGIDIRNISQKDLMSNIAFVFQDTKLLKTSIYENIKAARPNATREEVLAAAKEAQCDDILAKFPDGIDTVLGKKGVYLSGGEQQRIALARAILKDAPIVLLDEATAFADPENEYKIQKAFEHLTHGKTVLMIAHRLSTVQHSDCIYVLSKGKIAEQGCHDTLLKNKGIYYKMWNEYKTSIKWNFSKEADL
ncbi:MAG: ABC transporter ATP-binding protein [Clostridium butyricum]|nr:ABC transporter ATP-binding protein [Clostridium butyricum]